MKGMWSLSLEFELKRNLKELDTQIFNLYEETEQKYKGIWKELKGNLKEFDTQIFNLYK